MNEQNNEINDDYQQDLVNFIGRRIAAGIKKIKPRLSMVDHKEDEACREQEAVYLIGLADGMALAKLLHNEGYKVSNDKS